jgi:hypothetical protein
VEDQATHFVGEVDQHDRGLGALDTDGADEQTHMRLFPCEDMLDGCAYFGLGPVGGAQCS